MNSKQKRGIVLKIISKKLSYKRVAALPTPKHRKPLKPWLILRGLIRLLCIPDIIATKFSYKEIGMEGLKKTPCLILMNHSCFLDLEIAHTIFFKRPFCIVSTTDSYIGKPWLMPFIGCIPTQKFVSDVQLLSDIKYALYEKKCSVLMFPEAGYSFDGRATALPSGFAMLIKKLSVPVVMVTTSGAFLRQPLYNELKKRKVKVSATVECILKPEDIKEKSVKELDEILKTAFSFDNFKEQFETKTVVDFPERAKGLDRILYRCPNCNAEGFMKGEGIELKCEKCQKVYEMDVYGRMNAKEGITEFPHIPDWYDWERECVKNEIINKEYSLDTDVDIGIIKDYKMYYRIGNGHLTHNENGFVLTTDDGELEYRQSPLASHTLNADLYWYTIGDTIGIGNKDMLFYCFPKGNVSVVKTRLATEEIYKLKRAEKRIKKENG